MAEARRSRGGQRWGWGVSKQHDIIRWLTETQGFTQKWHNSGETCLEDSVLFYVIVHDYSRTHIETQWDKCFGSFSVSVLDADITTVRYALEFLRRAVTASLKYREEKESEK